MNYTSRQNFLSVITAAVIFAWAGAASAQLRAIAPPTGKPRKPVTTAPLTAPRGVVQDWSHRQVVFANPDTPQEAARKGRTAQWRANYSDPRFVVALTRKLEAQASTPVRAAAVANVGNKVGTPVKPPSRSRRGAIDRDWSHVTGAAATGRGVEGMYPAKYSFDIAATPSCANDFVVYGTNTAGATASANTAETWSSQFTGGTTTSTGSVIINWTGTPRDVVLTASATPTTLFQFQQSGTQAERATAVRDAVNRWTHQTGIRADISGAGNDVLTFSHTSAGNVPGATVTESLTNFGALTNVGNTDTAGQATIIAFNQLYSGCLGATPPKPAVLFAYNTGDGAVVRTSPVLSYHDGAKQLAFVQSNAGSASVVLLKWSAASPGTPGAPTDLTGALNVTPAQYRACTAPCMTVLPLDGGADVSFSSPFVQYAGDVLWVGDNSGVLHKFRNIFRSGTPFEVIGSGFPATVSAGNALSPPVYDFGNAQVLVGSGSLVGSGGALHRVNASTGVVTSSAKLTANTINPGIRSAPLVDASNGRAYAFMFNDGGTGCGGVACEAVVQFSTTFAAGSTGTKALAGAGNDDNARMYAGAFDDAYYNSASGTGALYVCGTTTASIFDVVMWKIPIVNNVMGTPLQGATLGTGVLGSCAPVSSVKNGANEYLFTSVPDNGVATGCTGACIYMVNLDDANGPNANANETWTALFASNGGNGQTAPGQTLVVGGVTLTTANGDNTGTNFDISGTRAQDAINLAAEINANVPGYSAVVVATNSVRISFNALGNVDGTLVTENLMSLGGFTNVDGAGGTAWEPTNLAGAGLASPGGTSGVIIDNISALPGHSQIYYYQLGTTALPIGNAIQASQSGLQ